MTTATPLDPTIYTDMQGLAQLRGRARAEGDNHTPDTLRKVAGQFEAMFVQMLLKNMRESSLSEGIFDSEQSQFYQGMYDQQIAQELSKGQGLGLADMLVRQMGGTQEQATALNAYQPGRAAYADPFMSPVAPPRPMATPHPAAMAHQAKASHDTTASDRVRVVDGGQWPPQSKQDFVRQLWPHAEQAARRLGVDARAIVAQAALETGWGKHSMRDSAGRHSHNLFGIKADSRWSGAQVGARTMEYRDGVLAREKASFRAYATPAESVADYAEFIATNPRYDAALGTRDPGRYVQELQRAGYATDPVYAEKIMSIFNSDEFQTAVVDAKQRGHQAAKSVEEHPPMTVPQDQTEQIRSASRRDGEV